MLHKLAEAAKLYLQDRKWVDKPEWDHEDEERLRSFLKTDTGKKLKAYLLNLTLTYNAEAVQAENNLEKSCGWASGFAGAVSTLDALAQPDRIYKAEPEEDDGSDLERYRP
jgi:hypothetical protein